MDNQMITALPDVAMVAVDRVEEKSAPDVPAIVKPEEKYWNLQMSWQGSVYSIVMGAEDMVYDFRERIQTMTSVPPERQKLIGLTKGKLPPSSDSERFGNAGIPHKPGVIKFTMIGTPEKDTFKDPTASTPEVFDDFDMAYPPESAVAPADDPRNLRKIQEKIKKCPIDFINEPRLGKKLLVLDLDYTIIDTKPLIDGSLPSEECARPGLHAFLEKAYEDYDIAIWSQTHWRWLEAKLVELGMLGGSQNYKICFVSDRTSMFPIFAKQNGEVYKHEVKPLAYFWARHPEWSAKNTIHIDDLSRNFAMNPGEGLKIRQFKGAATAEGQSDHELDYLGQYLTKIAQLDDFTTIDHAKWRTPYSRARR